MGRDELPVDQVLPSELAALVLQPPRPADRAVDRCRAGVLDSHIARGVVPAQTAMTNPLRERGILEQHLVLFLSVL